MNFEAMLNIIPIAIEQESSGRSIIRDSNLSGAQYYLELIQTESTNRFREVARMDRETFLSLKIELFTLQSSTHICAGQKLMIFISAMANKTNRDLQERWQHSGQTISKIIHEVADSILLIHSKFIFQELNPVVSSRISNNQKYSGYFSNCIGAIDGTHIPATLRSSVSKPFRNRKGFNSQNVLAACNFDMTFTYVLTGWEGSAHDGRVFADALTKGFPTREGRFYLGDAGYALSKDVLTPYRGTRYHLKEWGQSAILPRNHKELFNLRHSSLRNVIERVFGVVKNRFPTLNNMPSYSFEFQAQLVNCILILHTFIRKTQNGEDDFYAVTIHEASNVPASATSQLSDHPPRTDTEGRLLNEWRDNIAKKMWDDYVNYNYSR